MREIKASDAKTHLLRLLDAVEQGESIVITRRGQAIARLVPEVDRRQADIDRAIADIEEVRSRLPTVTVDEILAWRDEGRK